DERRRLRTGERSVERGFRVAAVALRTRDEIEMFHELPAGLAHEARVVALRGLPPGLHRKDREPGAAFDDLLRDVGAFAGDEVLARPIRRDGRPARLHIRADRRCVNCAKMVYALRERYLEWYSEQLRAVVATLKRRVRWRR